MTRRNVLSASATVCVSPCLAAVSTTVRLYRRSIVLDGNLIARSLLDPQSIDPDTAGRIRASGLTAFKQTIGGADGGYAQTVQAIADLRAAIARSDGLFSPIEHVSQIGEAKRHGRAGVIFSFESASMHEGRVDRIKVFAKAGVRVMGLSYNVGSPFGGGALQGPDKGLTSSGREALAVMAKQGVTVDLSHSNEATSLQVLAAVQSPVLITHAGCAAIHAHPRNKSDRLLKAVAANGGVTGIYDLSYLGDYPAHPKLDTYMRHLSHALDVCGEDHVGIGSDSFLLGMDTSPASVVSAERHEAARRGAGLAAPEELAIPYVQGLNGPNRWEVICRELLRRGYSERSVEKVLGTNFERVFAQTWSPETQVLPAPS
jgi:membrane dipeptidase